MVAERELALPHPAPLRARQIDRCRGTLQGDVTGIVEGEAIGEVAWRLQLATEADDVAWEQGVGLGTRLHVGKDLAPHPMPRHRVAHGTHLDLT